MESLIQLNPANRRELIEDTAANMGIRPKIVEKDLWVCWTLHWLFVDRGWSDRLIFKGGTSLSKVFNLINRFSEDVDLVLKVDGFPDTDFLNERSGNAQKRYCKELVKASNDFVREVIYPALAAMTDLLEHVELEENNLLDIRVEYPRCLDEEEYFSEYVSAAVKLEIGPRGLWEPVTTGIVRPHVWELVKDSHADPAIEIPVIDPVLTFWEKALILHNMAYIPQGAELKPKYLRSSRHYFDLMRMAESDHRNRALGNPAILERVVQFSERFFPDTKAGYPDARPGTFRLIPPDHVHEVLKVDYSRMRDEGMFFGDVPSFDEILKTLSGLQDEINGL